MIPIRQQREAIDRKVADIRDWYGLRVLEGLEEESRRLKWLTAILIVLTLVLTIFTGFLVSKIPFP
jgi:formate-dependent nitrite reductase membrane component NrfD